MQVRQRKTGHPEKSLGEIVGERVAENGAQQGGSINTADEHSASDKNVKNTQNDTLSNNRRSLPTGNVIICLLLTLVALWTRLYKIQWSDRVVWDEAHFGKFAGYYIKQTFYFDVHPPLGKMLNGLAGLIAGFNGKFEFESGATYPPEVKYGVMRFFNAIFGAMLVPLAYWTAIHLRMSRLGAILAGIVVICEIGLCAISRFILLDSMLLFFTALSLYAVSVFRSYQQEQPFSEDWYFWLGFTGLALGATVSVKWVGLFVIAVVGLHTIDDLWEMFGDLKMPTKRYLGHWAARIVCLIVFPILFYMLMFVFHFGILNRSGPGDGQMSSLFQAGLREIAYGSTVSIKNAGRGGGLLHSHVQKFPSGSEQQQITCYAHKDDNNNWQILKPWGVPERNDTDEVEFIEDGAKIRLNLPGHVTKTEYEVCGTEKPNDPLDHWDITGAQSKRIRSLSTRFRIRHVESGCYLRADRVTLPEWGFKQEEVICQKKGKNIDSQNLLWNIELHVNERLPPGGRGAYKSYFLQNFVDVNVGMWTSNNALTPDPDKEPDPLASKAHHWPFMLRGLRMCGWGDYEIKYYLVGNPLICWMLIASLVIFTVALAVYYVRLKRGFSDFASPYEFGDFWFAFKIGAVGWFLHYFPFFIMGRVLYVHHYLPALYIGSLNIAYVTDHFSKRLAKPFGLLLTLTVAAACIATFIFFKDFAFGMNVPASEYKNRKWVSSWNLYD